MGPKREKVAKNLDKKHCKKAKVEQNIVWPDGGVLKSAQKIRTISGGLTVSRLVCTKLLTEDEQKKKVEAAKKLPPTPALLTLLTHFSPPYNNICTIREGLLLTGIGGLVKEKIDYFGQLGAIMNCTFEYPLIKLPCIEFCRIPVNDIDKEDIYKYFNESTQFINRIIKSGKKILIHCIAGQSRSVTIVIAYLMLTEKLTLKAAFLSVKDKRSVIGPNIGFLSQLAKLELDIFKDRKACTPWGEYTKNGIKLQFPSFIIDKYIDEYDYLFRQ